MRKPNDFEPVKYHCDLIDRTAKDFPEEMTAAADKYADALYKHEFKGNDGLVGRNEVPERWAIASEGFAAGALWEQEREWWDEWYDILTLYWDSLGIIKSMRLTYHAIPDEQRTPETKQLLADIDKFLAEVRKTK